LGTTCKLGGLPGSGFARCKGRLGSRREGSRLSKKAGWGRGYEGPGKGKKRTCGTTKQLGKKAMTTFVAGDKREVCGKGPWQREGSRATDVSSQSWQKKESDHLSKNKKRERTSKGGNLQKSSESGGGRTCDVSAMLKKLGKQKEVW